MAQFNKKKFAFCCLGVKANEEGLFSEFIDPAEWQDVEDELSGIWFGTEYLPVVDSEAQSFLGMLNDECKLDFEQIATIIEHMALHTDQVLATADWLANMDHKERDVWVTALRGGTYKHQCRSALAQELDK